MEIKRMKPAIKGIKQKLDKSADYKSEISNLEYMLYLKDGRIEHLEKQLRMFKRIVLLNGIIYTIMVIVQLYYT